MNQMQIATKSRLSRNDTKLLHLGSDKLNHHKIIDLPRLIPENSLLVVNNASTLPASFHGYVGSLPVELRLVQNHVQQISDIRNWFALVFYKGSWRDRTEDRLNPDFLEIGDIIQIENLTAEVTSIHHDSKRMVSIKFICDLSKIWQYFYEYGKPIQYSHLSQELSLWDVQTIFSSVPVAVEPSSASFQFSWKLVNDLVQHGHQILAITHATSISSIGFTQLDKELPFPEYYWIDRETARIINHYYSTEGSIIAVGTSVTRALEDNITKFGKVQHGEYETVLTIDKNYHRKLVNGLLTGMHLPEESHYQLLQNFISEEELENGYKEAIDHNYLWHEYGDVSIITTSL